MLLTRPPLTAPKGGPFDLHVLGAPPAFVLSQDQTLHQDHVAGAPRKEPSRTIGELPARPHCGQEGNFVPAGLGLAAGPSEHGIDMSLRPRKRVRRPHWLLAFTALFSRNGSPTDASSRTRSTWASLRGDTHPLLSAGSASRPRSDARVGGVGVNVPPFRRPRGDSGVRGDWQDYRDAIAVSNRVASVVRLRPVATVYTLTSI